MEDRLQKLIEENESSDVEPGDSSPSAVAIVRFVRHQVIRAGRAEESVSETAEGAVRGWKEGVTEHLGEGRCGRNWKGGGRGEDGRRGRHCGGGRGRGRRQDMGKTAGHEKGRRDWVGREETVENRSADRSLDTASSGRDMSPWQLLRVMCLEIGAETRPSGRRRPAGSRHVSLPLARRHTLTAALLTSDGASRGASLVRHQCRSGLIGSRVVDTHRDNVVALDEWEALIFCVVRLNT